MRRGEVPRSLQYRFLETPIGELLLAGDGEVLYEIWLGSSVRQRPEPAWQETPAALETTATQLREYFAGQRTEFEVELALHGTEFQETVWRALAAIPFGTTLSYGELARSIGRPQAVRAVGAANGSNPIPIILPCHRVIGSDGSLTGYGGGLEIKQALLEHEGCLPPAQRQLF